MSAHPNIPLSETPGDTGGYISVRYQTVSDAGSAPAPVTSGRIALKDRGPEERAKLRDLWTKAKAAAHRLWLAAKDEPGVMFGAAVELKDVLARLWAVRSGRDDNWIGILDQARSALDALAEAGIETAHHGQCWTLFRLIEERLGPATKTVDDLKAAVRLVAEMNLNPFAGLEPLGGD